jgi:hypothetical protein
MISYNEWIDGQAKTIASAVNRLACHGNFTAAVYVLPSHGATAGSLVVSTSQLADACDVVRFPAQGSNVMAVPRSHLRSLLWNACRHMPILPVE